MKPINIEASGTYELIVRDSHGKIKYRTKEFKNLIVNQGIDKFMANELWGEYAFCGTGGTPPVVTNTGMQAFLAETNDYAETSADSVYVTPRYYVLRKTYTFAVGAVVGNVAEVGVGWKPTGSTRLVFSRSLVVDGGGSPTTITVLASEQLTIVYRLYVKVPDADTTFPVTDNGVTYTVTARQLFHAAYTGFGYMRYGFWGSTSGFRRGIADSTDVLPPINTNFPGSNNAGTMALGAYTSGSFVRAINFTFSGSSANFSGGIGSFGTLTGDGVGQWAFSFAPKINKISGQSLTLSFIYNFVRGTPP